MLEGETDKYSVWNADSKRWERGESIGADPAEFLLNGNMTYYAHNQSFNVTESPDTEYSEAGVWGEGSYMAFRDAAGRYGYLEVTWDPDTEVYEVLSGAYESQPGVPIAAGAVPEPSASASALLAGSALLALRRRRHAAA